MNLHHSADAPDWHKIHDAERTYVQKLAAHTRGVVTPANLISVIGLGLVVYGLWLITDNQIWLGLAVVVVGRLLDLVDGLVAEATKTKSPLGELVDASVDKAATVLSVIALLVIEVASWWIIGVLILPQLLIALVSLVKRRRDVRLQPSLAGKLSMALVWVSVAGLLILHQVQGTGLLLFSTYTAITLSVILGCAATWQYIYKHD